MRRMRKALRLRWAFTTCCAVASFAVGFLSGSQDVSAHATGNYYEDGVWATGLNVGIQVGRLEDGFVPTVSEIALDLAMDRWNDVPNAPNFAFFYASDIHRQHLGWNTSAFCGLGYYSPHAVGLLIADSYSWPKPMVMEFACLAGGNRFRSFLRVDSSLAEYGKVWWKLPRKPPGDPENNVYKSLVGFLTHGVGQVSGYSDFFPTGLVLCDDSPHVSSDHTMCDHTTIPLNHTGWYQRTLAPHDIHTFQNAYD